MSDTTKSTSGSKTSTSKSETAKPSDSTSTSTDSKSSSTDSASTPKSDGVKSGREAIGGASAVHYGFFSNVKTPQYRSGWDDIWASKSEPKKKKTAKTKEPVLISLALEDLPQEIQNGLADAARAQLKKSRINYDNRAKAGAVGWRIECEVKR